MKVTAKNGNMCAAILFEPDWRSGTTSGRTKVNLLQLIELEFPAAGTAATTPGS